MNWRKGLTSALWPAFGLASYLFIIVTAIILVTIKQPWI